MNMYPHERVKVLHRTAELIEQGWCQQAAALTRVGWALIAACPLNPQAERWCLAGAVQRALHEVYPEAPHSDVTAIFAELVHTIGQSVVTWNDQRHRTKDQVLTKIQKTITRLEL